MKKPRASVPFLRGLTLQLFVITVLPLTLLPLVIAFEVTPCISVICAP